MKSKICVFLAAVIVLGGLSGCGSNEINKEDTAIETTTESMTEASSGGWSDIADIGNNPNNLYQSEYCLAFDEGHIYYNRKKITSIDFNGKNKKQFNRELGRGLNVYNGYIYSFAEKVISRIKIDTDEDEILVQLDKDTLENESEITSIFLANGYLFYSIDHRVGGYSSKTNSTEIYAMNIDTKEEFQIYNNKESTHKVVFSADNEYIYALIKGSSGTSSAYNIRKMKISDISANNRLKAISDSKYYSIRTIIEPDGVYYIDNESDKSEKAEVGYKFKAFSENSGNKDLNEKFSENSNIMERFSSRFILDGNLIVLKGTNTGCDIYYYKDMKSSNEKLIGSSTVPTAVDNNNYGMFGIYNDTLYLVETTEGNTSENLVIVDKNGNITRTPIG